MMFMGTGMLVFWIVLIGVLGGGGWLITWLARQASDGSSGSPFSSLKSGPQTSGREILQARYARGEIDREQYLEILADLD